ncbi:DUF6591 domain-containing protein [Anaerostipes sp. PC18]|uniref:DUF6591 domain-containing protein n=1 Tax=Anaerostipes sp. PC18 TaxID=3036926 RepID=UPI003085B124|nr:hypothetical protein P8F77_10400 [Anaerostipes sp. PC18]
MRKRSKLLVVIGIAIILCFSFVACGKAEDNKGVKWPEGENSDLLPNLPEGSKITQISQSKDGLGATVKNISMDDCKDFAKRCKEKGFNEKVQTIENEGEYTFGAYNKKGNALAVCYGRNLEDNEKDKEMSVMIFPPEKETSKTK